MKKTIIPAFAILLTLAVMCTSCAKNTGKAVPTIEPAETGSIAADSVVTPTNKSEPENITPPIETELPEGEATPAETAASENPYVGTYRNSIGRSFAITISKDGHLQFRETDIDLNNTQEDGSILAWEMDVGPNIATSKMYIYPVGTPLDAYNNDTFQHIATDDSRLRLFMTFSDVPDVRTNVYYKVETLKEGDYSYLPAPGFIHEFVYDGIIGGTGVEWGRVRLYKYEETEDGAIKETVISAISDGKAVSTENIHDYAYYEDATGLYIREIVEYPIQVFELRIKYPLIVGDTFQSSGFYGTGTIEAVNETVTTAAGVFENVVVIKYEYGEGFYGEKHYFAPSVGLIKYEATRSGGELVKISK